MGRKSSPGDKGILKPTIPGSQGQSSTPTHSVLEKLELTCTLSNAQLLLPCIMLESLSLVWMVSGRRPSHHLFLSQTHTCSLSAGSTLWVGRGGPPPAVNPGMAAWTGGVNGSPGRSGVTDLKTYCF